VKEMGLETVKMKETERAMDLEIVKEMATVTGRD
jgi:hypothetical protein